MKADPPIPVIAGTRVEVILPVDFVSSTPFSAIRQTLSDELGELQKVLGSPQPSQYASRSNSFSASPSLCPMTTVPATASTLSSTLVDCEDSASEESVRTPPQESPRMAEGKLPPVASAGRRLTIFAAEDNSIARNILSAMFSQQKVSCSSSVAVWRNFHTCRLLCTGLQFSVSRGRSTRSRCVQDGPLPPRRHHQYVVACPGRFPRARR